MFIYPYLQGDLRNDTFFASKTTEQKKREKSLNNARFTYVLQDIRMSKRDIALIIS